MMEIISEIKHFLAPSQEPSSHILTPTQTSTRPLGIEILRKQAEIKARHSRRPLSREV